MKNKITLLGLIFVASLHSCDNSESFPIEENLTYELAVNVLNYSDYEFPEGTFIYLGATIKDTFIAIDSIEIKQKILSKNSTES